MKRIPISSLPAASSLDGTEVVPVVQEGVTKKADVNTLFDGVRPSFSNTAEAAVSSRLRDGEYYQAQDGYNGEPETFLYDAAATDTADGQTIVEQTELGGRLISTRKWFKTVDELLADNRTPAHFEASPASSVSTQFVANGFTYQMALTGASDHHRATTGGVKLYIEKGADGFVALEQYADSPSAADIQSALDDFEKVRGSGIYSASGISISGTDRHIDFVKARFNNLSTGVKTFIIGDVSRSIVDLGFLAGGSQAGDTISVEGVISYSRITYQAISYANPATSAVKMHEADGAKFYGSFMTGMYTRIAGDAYQVPAIDVVAESGSGAPMAQGNVFTFSYAYGSGYSGGADSVPFMRADFSAGTRVTKNDIHITTGEIMGGGAVHANGLEGSEIKVAAFDTGTWIGDIIRSTGGRNNTYRLGRKAGVRTATDFGSGAVSPFDIALDGDRAAVIHGSGRNTGEGLFYADFGGNSEGILWGDTDTWADISNQGDVVLESEIRALTQATDDGGTLTIASGEITVTSKYHKVDTEGAAATDDLTTINGGTSGATLILQSVANTRDITLVSGPGLRLLGGADFTLDRVSDTIELVYTTATNEWCEKSRSDNQS